MKLKEEDQKKLIEFHNLVIKGLNNGLTHTIWDGRREDIKWVRARLELWESFGRTVYDYLMEINDPQYSLRTLKMVAEEGYSESNEKEQKEKSK